MPPLPDPSPKALIRFHFFMMVVWLGMIYPTLAFWKESILWVAFMSLYANFVGHFSGWDAARAEENKELLDEVRALREEVSQLRAA